VAKKDVLARVREDLDNGHTYLATQRLRTLVSIDPDDFEVFRMLADVYRSTGNPVEAGRWGFLLDDVTDEELDAFERAHPWPWVRLRLIRWMGDPQKVPSEAGRQRLLALVEQVRESGDVGPADRWTLEFGPRRKTRRVWPVVVGVVILTAVGALGSVGLVRVLRFFFSGVDLFPQ
jgi:hypothetical protein